MVTRYREAKSDLVRLYKQRWRAHIDRILFLLRTLGKYEEDPKKVPKKEEFIEFFLESFSRDSAIIGNNSMASSVVDQLFMPEVSYQDTIMACLDGHRALVKEINILISDLGPN